MAGGVTAIIAVMFAVAWFYLTATDAPDDISTGPLASQIPASPPQGDISSLLQMLPSSAANSPPEGQTPQAPTPAAKAPDASDTQAGLGGTSAKGRVERVYVRVAEGVLLDLNTALPNQRDGLRYASIEFPEPLANGTTLARALIPDANIDLGTGDIVEMRFAHKALRGPYVANIFPVLERDMVIAMVSKSGTALAQDFQRRILARANAGASDGQIANKALWDTLPFHRAIKIVRGNGKHEMAMFSDPYCAACQAFEQTLGRIDDITLYVFMLPVIRPDKIDHSRSVWCSPDRAKAWVDLALLKKVPEVAPTCDNPVDAVLALLQPVGIRATPTVIFENGQRGQGNMLESALRERLARAETETRSPVAK